jgi:O-acetyl-ADP-ribose deacetylase (regulator of RNase III)
MDVNFILCDIKTDLVQAWKTQITKQLSVNQITKFKIYNSTLQECSQYENFDCIVSPANSNTILDGSFDLVISKYINPNDPGKISSWCQEYSFNYYQGYQLAGTCLLIPLEQNKPNVKFIAHTPTMRYPSNVKWNKEIVYNCMWSLLSQIYQYNKNNAHNKIETVFLTGFATGIGRFPPEVCAAQMILAYKHFCFNVENNIKNNTWYSVNQKSIDIEETYRLNSSMFE